MMSNTSTKNTRTNTSTQGVAPATETSKEI
ncbi:unannotated protein [freshwater metagenome]|uniref:Unannotated protein n=1 Tax=freshwater metagenome TaxID=449393 RepID=A0A6J7TM24_9ZZZZ